MQLNSIKVRIKLFFLTLVVLKHMMVSNSGVTVSGKEADKISEASFKKSSKLLTKQFIAVEDIICSKELDVVGKLGCSLGQKKSMLSRKRKKAKHDKTYLSLIAKSARVQGSERQWEASAGFSSP